MDPLIDTAGQPLSGGDFRLTCLNGFGDGWNHYAHSMAWFKGKIYVGTSRAQLAALRLAGRRDGVRPWPIESPDDIYDIDRRAQVWEYTPETDEWRLAYRSPVVHGNNGRDDVPSYIGFRGMVVLQDASDDEPCLYVSSWSPHTAHTPDVLRTSDGLHFAPIPRPPFGAAVRTCRSLEQFDGRVHLSPTASGTKKGFNQDISSEAIVYGCDNLAKGNWVPVNEEGFGNKANGTVFEMAQFNGYLYGGTVNPVTGTEIWKTKGGKPPYTWTKVLDHGAGRGRLNEGSGAMCVFKGALYIGCGIINGGYHRAAKIGPAAAEMIRIWPDDSWDLIVGEARHTRWGLKFPLSGFGPGFDSLLNGYFWRICEHEGWLYSGTFSWANMIPYMAVNRWPEDMLTMLRRWGDEEFVARFGGAELWRSPDGIHWQPVTRNGFGNKFNWGIRNIVSTPKGLFVATANPFGPNVAVKRDGRWQYVPNPRGGCEVWLGQSATQLAESEIP